MVQRVVKLSDSDMRNTAQESLQRNSFFAHPENVLLCMLSDQDNQVHGIAVNKILATRDGQPERDVIPDDNFHGGYDLGFDDENDSECFNTFTHDVHMFQKPMLNVKAKVYIQNGKHEFSNSDRASYNSAYAS